MIKDIVLASLPVIASVASTVGVAIGYLLKFKSIIKDKDVVNKELKVALKKAVDDNKEIKNQLVSEIDKVKKQVEIQEASLKEVVNMATGIAIQTEKVEKLVDETTIIREQLNNMLEK